MTLPASTTGDEGRGARILVVDDHAGNRELLRAILEEADYSPVVVASGRAALDLPDLESCELGLLDLRMPGMDGFELLTRIRARPRCSQMPIVFVTAHDELDVHERALQSGVDDFLLKPVRSTELLIRVRSLLTLSRTRRELERSVRELARGNEQLEEARVARRALASRVLHDLRNPLQGAILGAHLLGPFVEGSAEAAELVESLARAMRQMRRLMVDLADVERGSDEALEAHPRSVDLASLLDAVVSFDGERLESLQVSVNRTFDHVSVEADPALLTRVLLNLIEHCVRNAPPASSVHVTVHPDPSRVRIRIADQGPPLTANERRSLFDRGGPFERPGAGRAVASLGLVYCGLAVKAMNGSIVALDGDGGVGVAFVLDLPLALPLALPCAGEVAS